MRSRRVPSSFQHLIYRRHVSGGKISGLYTTSPERISAGYARCSHGNRSGYAVGTRPIFGDRSRERCLRNADFRILFVGYLIVRSFLPRSKPIFRSSTHDEKRCCCLSYTSGEQIGWVVRFWWIWWRMMFDLFNERRFRGWLWDRIRIDRFLHVLSESVGLRVFTIIEWILLIFLRWIGLIGMV